jgi:outer membrane autotransporter protein
MKKTLSVAGLMSCAMIFVGGAGVAQAAWDTSGTTITEETAAAADVIDDLAVASTDPVLTVALQSVTTVAEVQLALDTLSPDSVGSGLVGGVQASGAAAGSAVMGRMASLRSENMYAKLGQQPIGPAGTTAKENALDNPGVWGRAIATSGEQDEIDRVDGYDYDTVGMMFGYDMKFGSQILAGINAGYLSTDVDSGVNTEQDVDSFVVGVYGTWSPSDLYVDFGVAYNAADIDYTRDAVIGASTFKIDGETDADTFVLYSNLGYNLYYGEKWIVTPEVGIQYSTTDIDGYTEDGVGALDVKDDSVDLFSTTVALKYQYLLTDAFNFKFNAAWNHEFSSDNQSEMKSRYVASGAGAAYFKTEGIDVDDDKFALGLGGKFLITDSFYFDVDYTYEFADEFDAHTGQVSMKYTF